MSQSPMAADSSVNRRRVSLSRKAASARRSLVTSRAIFAAPTMRPSPSRIGETVTDTSIRRPFFARRTVSNRGTRPPLEMFATMRNSSSARSGGISIVTDWPIASPAL